MTGNCIASAPADIVAAQRARLPTSPRRINLKTLGQVRREMALVYRQMRAGAIESQDGTRYVYVLSQIGKMIEIDEIERRLCALEAKNESKY